MKKILLGFLGLIFLVTPRVAFADNKETTAADVTYSVQDSSNTHVTAKIQLTNATPNFYVSSYSLKLGFTTISNVTAADPSGPVTPTIQHTDSGQQITIPFTSVVTGQGNTLQFTLSFDTPNIASHNGTIWEVNIPGLSSSKDFDSFTTRVVVPESFGKPTFIKPEIQSPDLTFTKDQLGTSGISLAFGSSQTYAYNLTYHVENNALYPVTTDIALPPTTNYQDVSLDTITPKPDYVALDSDGNWLARYHLPSRQKLSITAGGLVAVSLTPKPEALSQKDRQTDLSQELYWQTQDLKITSLAKELKTPEAIYQYVVHHLSYDFSRVKGNQNRLGAVGILQNPSSAVCLEFTDLFIALSRAAGIPAREVDGFAYTQNTIARPLSLSQDILHAWPEYYDDVRQTWVMVDPTWENTTGGVDYFHVLDFDHIAFVVKGANSTYPIPAGGYKFANSQNEKDVDVVVTQEQITTQPTVNLSMHVPSAFLSGLPMSGSVTVKNTGSVLFPSQFAQITTQHVAPNSQNLFLQSLPPFGIATYPLTFQKTPFLTNTKDTVTMVLDGKKVSQAITVTPFSTPILIILGGCCFALLIAVLWLTAASARRLSVSRQ